MYIAVLGYNLFRYLPQKKTDNILFLCVTNVLPLKILRSWEKLQFNYSLCKSVFKGTVPQCILSFKSGHHGAIDLWNNSDLLN